MLTQMQHKPVSRNLPVQRRIVVEPMVPIDAKAEEAKVELVSFRNVEDPQDRDDLLELDGNPP